MQRANQKAADLEYRLGKSREAQHEVSAASFNDFDRKYGDAYQDQSYLSKGVMDHSSFDDLSRNQISARGGDDQLVYIPNQSDPVDVALSQISNRMLEDGTMTVMFLRMSEGVY